MTTDQKKQLNLGILQESEQNSVHTIRQLTSLMQLSSEAKASFNMSNWMLYIEVGAVHKRRRIFWAIFDTAIPHIGITTMICLPNPYLLISCNIKIWNPPFPLKYFDVFYGWPQRGKLHATVTKLKLQSAAKIVRCIALAAVKQLNSLLSTHTGRLDCIFSPP